MGYYTGYQIPTIFEGTLFPQLKDTILTPANFSDPLQGVWAVLLLIGVVGTLTYFFFSREHKGLIGAGSRIGIAAIMISFGASFGYTVMARVSLLIGRCYFLINDWIIKGIIAPLKSIIH